MDGVHLHVSVLDFMVTSAYVVIFLFLARVVAAKFADHPAGKALGSLI